VKEKPRIGIALGSGSARGIAHIGILRGLAQCGIEPDVVCGTSIGALIGAIFCLGKLDDFRQWLVNLSTKDVVYYVNLRLGGGGLADGRRLFEYLRTNYGDHDIESLKKTFACVGTNLNTGSEIWYTKGNLWSAVQKSSALPGIMAPIQDNAHWIVDGALVNPVPVSLCRALGADITIAVNLNSDIVGKHLDQREKPAAKNSKEKTKSLRSQSSSDDAPMIERLSSKLKEKAGPVFQYLFEQESNAPSLTSVMASSINIMQDRITRSRLAGEPPDLVLAPKLNHVGLMDFADAEDAITAGELNVRQMSVALKQLCEMS